MSVSKGSSLPFVLDSLPPPAAERQVGRLLLFQSNPQREALLRAALTGDRLELLVVQCAEDVYERVETTSPDVLVLDVSAPDWASICGALKAGPAAAMPVVLVDWHGWTEAAAVGALEAGADEYVGVPSHELELRARILNQLRHKRRLDTLQRLRAERDSLRTDASLDALTSVLNRRALDRALGYLEREDVELSVMFLDVDFFKLINDNFGHAVGDRVLAALGRLLKDQVRPIDVVGRFGGEEFVLVLRGAGSDWARRVADRMRQAIGNMTIAGLSRRITVSIGVATRDPGEATEALLARADLALYAAKSAGRNRVVLAPTPAVLAEHSFVRHVPGVLSRPQRSDAVTEPAGAASAMAATG